MTNERFREVFADLDQALEDERVILLNGQHDALQAVVDTKEKLLEELSTLENAESKQLAQLDAKLKRNQRLLDEAMKGIRSVADRLAVLRRVRRKLETYDANGDKQTIAPEKNISMEKRA